MSDERVGQFGEWIPPDEIVPAPNQYDVVSIDGVETFEVSIKDDGRRVLHHVDTGEPLIGGAS